MDHFNVGQICLFIHHEKIGKVINTPKENSVIRPYSGPPTAKKNQQQDHSQNALEPLQSYLLLEILT